MSDDQQQILLAKLQKHFANSNPTITSEQQDALERLIKVATNDTGQSRLCANFLLAWWNAGRDGGFDLTDLWGLDSSLVEDVKTVINFVAHHRHYPNEIPTEKGALNYSKQFEQIRKLWR